MVFSLGYKVAQEMGWAFARGVFGQQQRGKVKTSIRGSGHAFSIFWEWQKQLRRGSQTVWSVRKIQDPIVSTLMLRGWK